MRQVQSGMAEKVSGKDLKKIAESLGRFADVRETAKEPRDRVIVQANGTVIKFIAGSTWGTLIATVHATSQKFRAIIPARPLLQFCKNTSARAEYRVEDLKRGFEVGCTIGNLDLLRLDTKLPKVILPPEPTAESQGTIDFDADKLEALGSMMHATADNIYGYPLTVAGKIYTGDNSVRFAATDMYRMSYIDVPGNYELFGTVYGDFLDAVRGVGNARMEFWTSQQVTVENEMFKAIGKYRMLESAGPTAFAAGRLESIQYRAIVDRTKFVKDIRNVSQLDKAGRFALQLEGNAVNVAAFEDASHGWYAKADKILPVLTSTKSKQVGIGLRTGSKQPINVRIPEWTIEIAPVVLGQEK